MISGKVSTSSNLTSNDNLVTYRLVLWRSKDLSDGEMAVALYLNCGTSRTV